MYSHIDLIYFSPTHTSCKIARSIAQGLGSVDIRETDLTYRTPSLVVNIEDSLAIIAVPVYGGRVAETAVGRLESLQGNGTPTILTVLYGNRDYEDALLELRDIAIRQGFKPIAGSAFIGEHSYSRPDKPIAANRPNQEDICTAIEFGKKATALYFSQPTVPSSTLQIPGNFPYKVKGAKTPQTPITSTDLCVGCGYCIEICPTQAISLNNILVSDADLCIKCCACVKECRYHARLFETPYTDVLHKNYSEPKKPELFYI